MTLDSFLGGSVDDLGKLLNQPSPFSQFSEVKFITPKLDFKLDPDHFIRWLKAESDNDQYLDPPLGESYAFDVANMCEYSCLYVAMLLNDVKLKGELRIVGGKFGFWEHYWLRYTLGDLTYIIDLTLQQFVKNAPKLAICIEHINEHSYNNKYDLEGTLIADYVKDNRAFDFYVNPKNVK